MNNRILLLGVAAGALYLVTRKKTPISGIGATGWDYAKYELDRLGISLNQDYFALSYSDKSDVMNIAKKSGYRQSSSSKASGRSYTQAFWYAMQDRY